MERQQILDVIFENMRLNIDGLEGQEIDSSKSMADYGAGSLDIVEVVSSSMRQLRLRVPRTELAKLKNIDQLTDLFTRLKSANG